MKTQLMSPLSSEVTLWKKRKKKEIHALFFPLLLCETLFFCKRQIRNRSDTGRVWQPKLTLSAALALKYKTWMTKHCCQEDTRRLNEAPLRTNERSHKKRTPSVAAPREDTSSQFSRPIRLFTQLPAAFISSSPLFFTTRWPLVTGNILQQSAESQKKPHAMFVPPYHWPIPHLPRIMQTIAYSIRTCPPVNPHGLEGASV